MRNTSTKQVKKAGLAEPIRVLCLDHEGGHGGSSRSLSELLSGIQELDSLRLSVWFKKDGVIRQIYKDMNVDHLHVPEMPTLSTVHQLSRNIYSILKFIIASSISFPKLFTLIRKAHQQFDVIHFNHPNLWGLGILARCLGNTPITFHIRVSLVNLSETPVENKLFMTVNKFSSKIFASIQIRSIAWLASELFFVSAWDQQQFRRLSKQFKGTVLFNSIKARNPKYKIGSHQKSKLKKRIVSVENYVWSRGSDRLLDLANYMKENKVSNIEFHVVGDMEIPERIARRHFKMPRSKGYSLEALVTQMGLQNFFVFYGHLDDPENIIMRCDLLLSLSRRAGPFGRSVIESMLMGLPVIACGDAPGFVIHNSNGLFFEEFDANIIGSNIVDLLERPDNLNRMSKSARSFALENFASGLSEKAIKEVWMRLGR